ncbi:hypothetical protein LIPSTDRAFT_67707 [Lipomyces starkeyi NRRL Y-11557]|uniref:Uncharacterized protein n=1 Tax=Lipomyces starkeyi NRRL Y-11557 TaxID=675824 RepID=A0A1E3QGA4_LIPST|nr:hypothetical protein LIPSTDRAFT_67707 [Lipomyces starkeyi NRRL Y-11557]
MSCSKNQRDFQLVYLQNGLSFRSVDETIAEQISALLADSLTPVLVIILVSRVKSRRRRNDVIYEPLLSIKVNIAYSLPDSLVVAMHTS